jgi:hypothetical protein
VTALERRGLRNLTALPRPLSKRAVQIVRIYYRSQGGELLCCDSDPLTWQAADKLRSEMRAPCSDAEFVEVYSLGVYSPGVSPTPQSGARFVRLPHQVRP